MDGNGELSHYVQSITEWLDWGLWLGVGAGALMIIAGAARAVVGRQAERPYEMRHGIRTVINGVALGIGCAVISAALPWLLGTSGKSTDPKPSPDGAGDVTEALMWGGLGVGALGLVALGGWGAWSWRQRHLSKKRRRKALEHSHDAVATAYADYLSDVLEWLDRPTLSDVSVPETAALVQALAAADDARLGDDVDRYQQAVATLRTAWQAADDHARRTGLRQLAPIDRRAAEQARKLLATALDTGAGDHERRSAYAKARDLLDGILVVPPQAVTALEDSHRLALAPKTF